MSRDMQNGKDVGPKEKEEKNAKSEIKALNSRISELEKENGVLRNLATVLQTRVERLTQVCASTQGDLNIAAANLISIARNPDPPPTRPTKEIIKAEPKKS